MANNLLEGWSVSTLKNLISLDGIFTDGDWIESKDQDPNGSIRLIQLADIGDGKFLDRSSRFVNKEKFISLGCEEIFENDVLIARMPDPLGRACILQNLPQQSITVVDIAIIRPGKNSVLPKWLMHFINAPEIRQKIELLSTGTTRKRISRSNLEQISIPVPPINEQKRIADKLDRLMVQVDACREHLERSLALIKRFRQAVLAAATSGRLTQEWREAKEIPINSWINRNGADIFPFITSGSRGWAAYYAESGPIFLRVGNLDHDTIELDLAEIQHVNPPDNAEGKRTRIELGDILISITADVGMVALIRKDIGEAYINQHICLARQSGEYSAAFLAYYLASPSGLGQFINSQRGMTKQGLTLGDIKSLNIQIPDIKEQEEIVRRVEALFAPADRLEARYQAARKLVNDLNPALLAKAFRGELVPQDPNDEPASVLLERIRVEREARAKETGLHRQPTRKKTGSKVEGVMRKLTEITPTYLSDILKENGSMLPERLWAASELEIEDFYDQLMDEELKGLLKEIRNPINDLLVVLEAL